MIDIVWWTNDMHTWWLSMGSLKRVELVVKRNSFRIDLIGIVRLKTVNDFNVSNYSINSAARSALSVLRKLGRQWQNSSDAVKLESPRDSTQSGFKDTRRKSEFCCASFRVQKRKLQTSFLIPTLKISTTHTYTLTCRYKYTQTFNGTFFKLKFGVIVS